MDVKTTKSDRHKGCNNCERTRTDTKEAFLFFNFFFSILLNAQQTKRAHCWYNGEAARVRCRDEQLKQTTRVINRPDRGRLENVEFPDARSRCGGGPPPAF